MFEEVCITWPRLVSVLFLAYQTLKRSCSKQLLEKQGQEKAAILKSVCRAILVFLADILCDIGIDEKTLYSS